MAKKRKKPRGGDEGKEAGPTSGGHETRLKKRRKGGKDGGVKKFRFPSGRPPFYTTGRALAFGSGGGGGVAGAATRLKRRMNLW